MNKYHSQTEIFQPTQQMDRSPFLHTRQAGVEVPILQGFAMGVLVFLLMAAIGWWAGWMDVFAPALVVGLLTATAVSGTMLRLWTRQTMPSQPQVQTRSVDHDGDASTPKIIRVQIDKSEDGHVQQWKLFDLPATEDQMRQLAVGLLEQKRPFSEREWTGAGRPFSVNEFRDLRSELIRRGLMGLRNEKDTRQGYVPTDDGKVVFEQFLDG